MDSLGLKTLILTDVTYNHIVNRQGLPAVRRHPRVAKRYPVLMGGGRPALPAHLSPSRGRSSMSGHQDLHPSHHLCPRSWNWHQRRKRYYRRRTLKKRIREVGHAISKPWRKCSMQQTACRRGLGPLLGSCHTSVVSLPWVAPFWPWHGLLPFLSQEIPSPSSRGRHLQPSTRPSDALSTICTRTCRSWIRPSPSRPRNSSADVTGLHRPWQHPK